MQALNLPLPGALVTKVGPEFRFIEINGTKQAEGPPVAMGTRVIEPKELWHILIGDSNQFPPDKWAVVDLRRKGKDSSDHPGNEEKIAGAISFPLMEDPKAGDVDYQKLYREDGLMAKLAAAPDCPLSALKGKPYIVFHCRQSLNRTPWTAGAYQKCFASQRGQTIFILKGGFIDYRNLVKEDGSKIKVPGPNGVTTTWENKGIEKWT